MKKIYYQRAVFNSLVSVALLFGCSPDVGKHGLGGLPKAQFTATVASDGYTVSMINNSDAIAYWKIPGMGLKTFTSLKGDTINMRFTFPGQYTITMLAVGHGGMDSTSVDITTSEPDPDACKETTPLGFLASCTQKVWKLLPDAGAYKVGPNGPNDGSWWTNGASDVTDRACEFDDEYTFVFGSAYTFIYNSHGDFYDDGYMGNQTHSCEPESNFTATQAPWGSGTHSYAVIPGGGVNKLGQITVIGLGAHMGLEKVTTNAEVTSGPVTSITYDIISMTQDPTGDVLVIAANMGWGWWTFAFKAEL
ncbi:MAG: hypothetical protein QM734_07455 [Cyclobacteriaceae bacterium]